MRRTRRHGRLLLIAAGLVAATVATLAGVAAAGVRQGQVTISVMDYVGPSRMGPLIKNFEQAYPNIKVQEDYVQPGAIQQALATALQAGNAADVILTNGGTGQTLSVLTLAKAGQVVDLSKQPWAHRVPAGAHDLYYVGKGLYGLPLGADLIGIIYNRDIFNQLKIQVPTTFSQLLGVCKKLQADGKIPIALAGMNPTFSVVEASASTVYGPQPNWNTLKDQHKVSFAGTKGWLQAVNEFQAMKSNGCFSPGAAAVSIPQSWNEMASGQGVMYIGPPAALGAISGINPNFHGSNFPFPAVKAADTRAITGYSYSLSVNAKSSHIPEAIKFVNFFAREGQDRLWATLNGSVSLHDANVVKNIPSFDQAFLPFLKSQKTVQLPYLSWQGSDWSDAGPKGLQGVLTGQTTPAAWLSEMDQGW